MRSIAVIKSKALFVKNATLVGLGHPVLAVFRNPWIAVTVWGGLGWLVGFFISGLVRYNWGDSEVVMIFYFIMRLSLTLEQSIRDGFGESPKLTLQV